MLLQPAYLMLVCGVHISAHAFSRDGVILAAWSVWTWCAGTCTLVIGVCKLPCNCLLRMHLAAVACHFTTDWAAAAAVLLLVLSLQEGWALSQLLFSGIRQAWRCSEAPHSKEEWGTAHV
jgi:hypothetical protein